MEGYSDSDKNPNKVIIANEKEENSRYALYFINIKYFVACSYF